MMARCTYCNRMINDIEPIEMAYSETTLICDDCDDADQSVLDSEIELNFDNLVY